MNPFRAKQIAESFTSVGLYEVHNHLNHVQVSYHGRTISFENEHGFWSFMLYLSTATHHQSLVGDLQQDLAA